MIRKKSSKVVNVSDFEGENSTVWLRAQTSYTIAGKAGGPEDHLP